MTVSPVLLAACTALIVFSAFNIKQEPKEGEQRKQENAICTTASCFKAAGSILDKLDQTVHPCKDFYQFACGNYIRRTILPENVNMMSVVQLMEDEVLMMIYRALESPRLYRTGGSLIKAKMLYETCMNSDSLEDDSVRVLRLFLSEKGVGYWPVLEMEWLDSDINLEWRLAMLFVHHVPVFFHMFADPAPSLDYILNIYPASSPLGSKEVPNNPEDHERIFEAYHKLLVETLRLLGVAEPRVQRDSFDIIGFELQFATITNISQQCIKNRGNETLPEDMRVYNVTITELEDIVPEIKWTRLMSYIFRNLGLQIDTTHLLVMVHCSEYFRHLGTLLSNTPPRTLANYMSWKFMLGYMSFMSTPFRQIFQDYTLLTPELRHSKLKTYNTRWKGCVSLVGSWFGTAVAAYYSRYGYPEDVEANVRNVVSSLKATFVEMIASTSWLDEESKNVTIEKALAMKEEIGYPRHLLNSDHVENFYAKLELSTDSLLKNMLKMSRFLVHNELQKLNQPVEEHRQLIDRENYTKVIRRRSSHITVLFCHVVIRNVQTLVLTANQPNEDDKRRILLLKPFCDFRDSKMLLQLPKQRKMQRPGLDVMVGDEQLPIAKNEDPLIIYNYNIYKGPLQGNAHYFPTKNILVVPLGVMRSPMFDPEHPKFLNYGMLGNEIGHEIAHGFDNIGLQYDKDGQESKWWSEEMKNKFWKKAKCFVDQYNRYVIDLVGEHVDGQRTLHENIADSAGINLAFMSYQRFVKENGKEPRLPGMEFTNQQLFFISFAQMKCEVRNKEGYEEYVGDSNTALLQTPLRYRVNGALSNSEYFSAVFKCPSGSAMSKSKRCFIW